MQLFTKSSYGQQAIAAYLDRNTQVRENRLHYETALLDGHDNAIYHFGDRLVEGEALSIDHDCIRIPGYDQPISLHIDNPLAAWSNKPNHQAG